MNFKDAMDSHGRARDWRDAVEAIKAAMTARGQASRYLADRYGVSRRTAQKWLKGDQAPAVRGGTRGKVQGDRNASLKIAADKMRNARGLAVGKVQVIDKSKGNPAGNRNVGVVAVDPQMRQELATAAELLEAGMVEQAQQIVSDAIMGGYGQARGGNRETARGALEIDDYPGGINFI